jgi:hypothetical protein
MKKVKIAVLLVTVISFMGLFMLGCSSGDSGTSGGEEPVDPILDDFNIPSLTFGYTGSPIAVNITAKTGKTSGAISVKYDGVSTAPTNVKAGIAVTFDVAASSDGKYNAVTDMAAGTMTITPGTPVTADFTISGVTTYQVGTPVNVSILANKAGKTNGAVSNITYGTSGATVPTEVGSYPVTFNVAASSDGNWIAATGISAGGSVVIQAGAGGTPQLSEYTIENLIQTVGGVIPVVVKLTTPGQGSPGVPEIWYEGIYPTTFAKSTTLPLAAGTYRVTFIVPAAGSWSASDELLAGTLIIRLQSIPADLFLKPSDAGLGAGEVKFNQASFSQNAGTSVTLDASTLVDDLKYTIIAWYVNGTNVNNNDASGKALKTFVFTTGADSKGVFTISVVVSKDGIIYNADAKVEFK